MGRVSLDDVLAAGDPNHVTEHILIAKALNGFNAILPSGDTTGATDQAAIDAALAVGGVVLMPGHYYARGVAIPSSRRIVGLGHVTWENADGYYAPCFTNDNWAVRGTAGANKDIGLYGLGRFVVQNYRGANLTSAMAIGDTTMQTDLALPAGTYIIDPLGSSTKETVVVTNGNTTSATAAPYTAALSVAATKAHVNGKGLINQTVSTSLNAGQALCFVGVTGLEVRGLHDVRGVYSALSTFGCADVNVNDFTWKHTFQPGHGADGIDIGPDSTGHTYSDVGGYNTDDAFSFFAQRSASMIPQVYKTALGLPTAANTSVLPDILDISVTGVNVDPQGDNVIRLQCGDGGTMKRVHFKDVTSTGATLLKIGERTYVNTVAASGKFQNITLSNFATKGAVLAICSDIHGLTVQNGTTESSGALHSNNGTSGSYAPTVKNLVMSNITHDVSNPVLASSMSSVMTTLSGAVYDHVTISGVRATRAEAILANAGTVTDLLLTDVQIKTMGNIPFQSTVAETGSVDRLTIDTYGGSATALSSGAIPKLRMGSTMPIFTSADPTPVATKGSILTCDNTKDPTGGSGTTAGQYVGNGTAWTKAVDLGAMAGR